MQAYLYNRRILVHTVSVENIYIASNHSYNYLRLASIIIINLVENVLFYDRYITRVLMFIRQNIGPYKTYEHMGKNNQQSDKKT